MPIDPTRAGGHLSGQSNRIDPTRATPRPCQECGCLPDDAWGCDCTNEDCPCSEPEDGDEEA